MIVQFKKIISGRFFDFPKGFFWSVGNLLLTSGTWLISIWSGISLIPDQLWNCIDSTSKRSNRHGETHWLRTKRQRSWSGMLNLAIYRVRDWSTNVISWIERFIFRITYALFIWIISAIIMLVLGNFSVNFSVRANKSKCNERLVSFSYKRLKKVYFYLCWSFAFWNITFINEKIEISYDFAIE